MFATPPTHPSHVRPTGSQGPLQAPKGGVQRGYCLFTQAWRTGERTGTLTASAWSRTHHVVALASCDGGHSWGQGGRFELNPLVNLQRRGVQRVCRARKEVAHGVGASKHTSSRLESHVFAERNRSWNGTCGTVRGRRTTHAHGHVQVSLLDMEQVPARGKHACSPQCASIDAPVATVLTSMAVLVNCAANRAFKAPALPPGATSSVMPAVDAMLKSRTAAKCGSRTQKRVLPDSGARTALVHR